MSKEKWGFVVDLQGSEANEIIDMINEKREDAAVEYLKGWDQGVYEEELDNDPSDGLGWDYNSYEDDSGYMMIYNSNHEFVSLYYKTK